SWSFSCTSTSGWTTVFFVVSVAMINLLLREKLGGLDLDLPRLRAGVLGQRDVQDSVAELGFDLLTIYALGQGDATRELVVVAFAAKRLVALGDRDLALGGDLDPVVADRQLESLGVEPGELGAEDEGLLVVIEAELAGLRGEGRARSALDWGHERVEQHVHRPVVIGGIDALNQHDRLLVLYS